MTLYAIRVDMVEYHRLSVDRAKARLDGFDMHSKEYQNHQRALVACARMHSASTADRAVAKEQGAPDPTIVWHCSNDHKNIVGEFFDYDEMRHIIGSYPDGCATAVEVTFKEIKQ